MPSVAARELEGLIEAEVAALVELRHDLHRHPQLAYEETYASQRVQARLTELGVPFEAGFAETGVIGWIEPTDDAARVRPAVGLRADMDALPITEETGVPYASETQGVMHACGHDGHTTILLGAATVLAKLRERLPRPVKLVFQPAEEGRAGGKKLMEAGVLTEKVGGHRVAQLFGLHGWPWLELGVVGCKEGPIMASMDDFTITVRGAGGHGAAPHTTADPMVAAAQIVTALQSIVSRNVDPLEPAVLTVGTLNAGQAPNIIPDTAELTGTIRALSGATAQLIHRRLREIAESIAAAMGCVAEVTIHIGYPVTLNDADCADTVLATACDVLGEGRSVRIDRPSMAAEDFAFYGQSNEPADGVPSAFYFLGLRPADREEYPGLHTPRFDFHDGVIPTGVRMMCELALRT
ncbi:MAG: M20 metallopeptidase family protein [Phycisphaeraceae bacterium]